MAEPSPLRRAAMLGSASAAGIARSVRRLGAALGRRPVLVTAAIGGSVAAGSGEILSGASPTSTGNLPQGERSATRR